MTSNAAPTVHITRHFDASPERVFDAWLDPQRAGKWLFATPTGQLVRAEIDARVGGAFRFTDRRDGEDVDHVGTYLEIARPRRLAFTFAVPKFSDASTRVTVEINPDPTGGCELVLTHEGVLPQWLEPTRSGWRKILATLASNVDPNAKYGELIEPNTLRFERLLPGPIERIWSYLVEPEKRAQWFGGGGIVEPRAGGLYELNFNHNLLSTNGDAPPPKGYEQIAKGGGPNFRETVLRYEPPRVLSWTWVTGPDGAKSEVTFELSPRDDGKVLFTLTHRKLDPRDLADTAGGWHTHLAILDALLNGREHRRVWAIMAEIEGVYEARLKR